MQNRNDGRRARSIKSLNNFPNLQLICKKDEKQKHSLEKLLSQKPNVIKSLDIYAQNIETYLKEQRKRIQFIKKKETPQLQQEISPIYDEAVIQQYQRVLAKQYYLKQSQQRSSKQHSPEQLTSPSPPRFFDRNYTPLKRVDRFDIASLHPVTQSPPKQLYPLNFSFYYSTQIIDNNLKTAFEKRNQWQIVPHNLFAHFLWLSKDQLFDYGILIKQEVISKRQMINMLEFQQEWTNCAYLYNLLYQESIEFAFEIMPPAFVIDFKIFQWEQDLNLIQDFINVGKRFLYKAYIPNKSGITYTKQIIENMKQCSTQSNQWILKSGNCQFNTIINNLDHLAQILNQQYKNHKEFVIQNYISNPMLFQGKKFHIRFDVLVNQDNLIYLYTEPTGKLFFQSEQSQEDTKYLTQFQEMTFEQIKKCLQNLTFDELLSQIKILILKLPCKLNRRMRKYCMQFFRLKFILDSNNKLFLLDIEANPTLCFEALDTAFQLTIDKIFPLQHQVTKQSKWIQIV